MPIQGGKMLLVVLGLHSTANYFDKMSSVVLHASKTKFQRRMDFFAILLQPGCFDLG